MSLPPPPPPHDRGSLPPAPQWNSPPPGYSPYGTTAPTSTGTNGLAVASLVLGIASVMLFCFLIPPILAIIFGGVALGQIKRNPGQGGRGMAIAGLTLGIVGLALMVLFVAVGSFSA